MIHSNTHSGLASGFTITITLVHYLFPRLVEIDHAFPYSVPVMRTGFKKKSGAQLQTSVVGLGAIFKLFLAFPHGTGAQEKSVVDKQ